MHSSGCPLAADGHNFANGISALSVVIGYARDIVESDRLCLHVCVCVRVDLPPRAAVSQDMRPTAARSDAAINAEKLYPAFIAPPFIQGNPISRIVATCVSRLTISTTNNESAT